MDQGVHVRLVQPPVPLKEQLRTGPAGDRQLIDAVAVQVVVHRLPFGPEKKRRRAVVREGVVVGERAVVPLVQPAVVGDSQSPLAEEVREDLHAVLRQPVVGIPGGDGQKAVPLRLGNRHGGAKTPIGGAVDLHVEAVVKELLRFKACDAEGARRISAAPLHLEFRGPVGLQPVQGNHPLRLPGRVSRGNGGRVAPPVGQEPVAAVLLGLQSQADRLRPLPGDEAAVPVAENRKTAALVVQENLAVLPLAGGESDVSRVIRVPAEVIVGVVFLQVRELVQAPLVRLIQTEAQVLPQNRVHSGGGALDEVHARVLAAIARLRHSPALLLRDVHGVPRAVVEELEEVDLPVILGGLYGQEQELVAHIEAVAVENRPVEPLQLLRCQRAVLQLRRLRPGEGAGAHQRRQPNGQHRRPQPAPGRLGDAAHPLPEAPLVSRHGGGAAQQVPGLTPGGDQGQQGVAVGPALAVPQDLQRPLIAGQLPVPAAQYRRQPYQRVPPVDRQGRAPEKRPEVVPLAVMGGLVGQYMAESQPVRRRLGGDVYRRAEHPEQTGGGQSSRRINRQGGGPPRFQRDPNPPQLSGEAQVGEKERRRHPRRPRQPDSAQQGREVQGLPGRRDGGGFLSGGGRDGLRRRTGLLAGGRRFRRKQPPGGKRLNRADLRKHPGGLHGGGEKLPRHQQPHQGRRPQGIPQPGADPSPEGRPEQQHRGGEQGGRGHPIQQKVPHSAPPFSAWSRMARSWAISSPESSCRWAMALIIIPTLPRYTRSRKLRVSATAACSRSTSGV